MRLLKALPCLLLTIIALSGCKKEPETLLVPSLSDYYPLQTGKSFTYRLDSTLYVSFGTAIKVNSYTAKDSIISTFDDNLGRTSYLVYRYLTDTLQINPFVYSSSYYITSTNKTVEVTDADNLRYIKLTAPVSTSALWNGNAYVDASSSQTAYLNNWQYKYQNIDEPFAVLAGAVDSTITVLQNNDSTLTEPFDPYVYQSRSYSSEVYAKGIGLVYKDLFYWVYQPLGGITPGYTAESFGIRLNLISHN